MGCGPWPGADLYRTCSTGGWLRRSHREVSSEGGLSHESQRSPVVSPPAACPPNACPRAEPAGTPAARHGSRPDAEGGRGGEIDRPPHDRPSQGPACLAGGTPQQPVHPRVPHPSGPPRRGGHRDPSLAGVPREPLEKRDPGPIHAVRDRPRQLRCKLPPKFPPRYGPPAEVPSPPGDSR